MNPLSFKSHVESDSETTFLRFLFQKLKEFFVEDQASSRITSLLDSVGSHSSAEFFKADA